MADTASIVGTLYDLRREQNFALANGVGVSSFILNTRDLGQPGAPNFVLLGPGSQVWRIGYAIRIRATGTPTLPLQFTVRLEGSYDTGIPFFFAELQRISLPVYPTIDYDYEGSFRVEAPAAELFFFNGCGVDCTVSFQCWGKAF